MNRFNAKFWAGAGLAVIFGLLLAGRAGSSLPATTNGGDVVITGFLACHEGNAAGRLCPSGIHYIDLVEGRMYDMRMVSSEFDTRLVLEDMIGNQLAADNDDFDTLNGRLVFRAPATGSFRLIAAANQPKNEGFYTITIRAMPMVVSVEDVLSPGDEMRGECYCKDYDVPMTAGRRYIIDLTSEEFAGFVKLTTMDGAIVAFADEARPGGVTRLVYEAPRTEMLRIVCTSGAPAATGLFTLNVCEE
jgi:hypothetical protein